MSDPVSGTYRSKEEVSERTEKEDPIKILRDRLFDAGILTQEALETMDQEARAGAEEAVTFAENAPAPDSAELYTHVYSQINQHGRLFFDGRDR
jgi:pyruvate dehydrogenase E1 component alpha subunit